MSQMGFNPALLSHLKKQGTQTGHQLTQKILSSVKLTPVSYRSRFQEEVPDNWDELWDTLSSAGMLKLPSAEHIYVSAQRYNITMEIRANIDRNPPMLSELLQVEPIKGVHYGLFQHSKIEGNAGLMVVTLHDSQDTLHDHLRRFDTYDHRIITNKQKIVMATKLGNYRSG